MEEHLFDAIKNFVADLANGDKPAGGFADQDLRVATAALLVHAAAIDGICPMSSATGCEAC